MTPTTYITRQQAAHIARVHLRTIDRWLDAGILTRHHIHRGRIRIDPNELKRITTPHPHDN